MSARRAMVALTLFAGTSVALAAAGQQFRTSVTGVSVHASVRRNGAPVTGLTAADFSLRDSGRLQEITAVSPGPLPLDVTLVVEQRGTDDPPIRDYYREMTEAIGALSKDDRLRVISAGSDAWELVPLGSAPRPRIAGIAPPRPSASGSVFDALTAALVRSAPPGRQHVVILMTSAVDPSSLVHFEDLERIILRSDAQLHVVLDRPIERVPLTHRPRSAGNDAGSQLWTLARQTGGDRIWDAIVGRSIEKPVQKVFDSLRAGYILYYTPASAEPGWRPIEVTVAREGRYEVKARAGYIH
jgi:VWFA-related protein